jgi:hypothetical protein
MHDQQQDDQMPAEDRREVQMRKTGFQPLLELNAMK